MSLPGPRFNLTQCNACGVCESHCPQAVLVIKEKKPHLADPTGCNYCGICEEICPNGAVELVYRIFFSSKY